MKNGNKILGYKWKEAKKTMKDKRNKNDEWEETLEHGNKERTGTKTERRVEGKK